MKKDTVEGVGDTEKNDVQKISIVVSEPQISHLGDAPQVFYIMVTRAVTSSVGGGTMKNHITHRTYKEISNVYQHLDAKYLRHGIIVPLPPTKESIKLIEDIRNGDERKSSTLQSFHKKCVALDRYMKRLIGHPVLSKDIVLNRFIQNKDISRELSFELPMIYKGSGIGWRQKIVTNRLDDWFMYQTFELKALQQEMEQTLESFQSVTKKKGEEKTRRRQSLAFRKTSINSVKGKGTHFINCSHFSVAMWGLWQ